MKLVNENSIVQKSTGGEGKRKGKVVCWRKDLEQASKNLEGKVRDKTYEKYRRKGKYGKMKYRRKRKDMREKDREMSKKVRTLSKLKRILGREGETKHLGSKGNVKKCMRKEKYGGVERKASREKQLLVGKVEGEQKLI